MVLPPAAHGRITADNHRRWLSRGSITFAEPRSEMLLQVLDLIGAPKPESGMAALRFWGQTGERSGTWMAAADAVHLETRLHSLRMRSLRPDELPESDLRPLFDRLQSALSTDTDFAFTRIGQYGYLRGEGSIDTAPMSARVLHGLSPDEYLPTGDSAVAYHQLLGEVQMVLHEHEINQRRARSGVPEINSLWLWGGGLAPKAAAFPLPKLFSDDPLFKGYWHSCDGDVAGWNGKIENMIGDSPSGFVAVLPDLDPESAGLALHDCLDQLQRNTVKSLTLLFRDGLSARINRWDTLRILRGISPLLEKKDNDD